MRLEHFPKSGNRFLNKKCRKNKTIEHISDSIKSHSALLWIFLCLLVTPLTAQEPMRLPVDSTPLVVETKISKTYFDVEIAISAQELSRGLMFRTDFPSNRAMLFVFDRTHIPSMWMKNTPLPLDMLFVDEQGTIVSIFTHAEPFSLATISSAAPAAYVIEINAGEAKKRNITEGDRIIHPIICATC